MEWLLVGLVAAGAVLLWWRGREGPALPVPAVGETAPEFSLPDQHGTVRSLAGLRGRWVVLYFYPKDNTPGCTKQACAFRDETPRLLELDATVIGMSVDSVAAHRRFAARQRLPFALLADRRGAVARRYGSLAQIGPFRFARRNTFVIDPQGRIARVYVGADAARNALQVIGELARLQGRHAGVP
jgi:thioredoxin-dependent peroxiredoxin